MTHPTLQLKTQKVGQLLLIVLAGSAPLDLRGNERQETPQAPSNTTPSSTEKSDPTKAIAALSTFEPSEIDRMQANLAQQNHTLDTLLEVVKKLEDLSKYDEAARTLLASKSEGVIALQEALSAMETKGNNTSATPKIMGITETPKKTTTELKQSDQQIFETKTDFHAKQILYAQSSNHQRNGITKVIINTGEQRLSLNQGQAMELGTDRWLLVDVQLIPNSNQMHVSLRLNGHDHLVRYPTL